MARSTSTSTRKRARPRGQVGGTVIGFVAGVVVGLAAAVTVAIYVTKVPVPFVNKVQQRTPEQDAAEAERNRHWNPNAALQSQTALPEGVAAPAGAAAASPGTAAPGQTATAPTSSRDPAAILGGAPVPGMLPIPVPESIEFYVQAGAYQRTAEAEQQRARLAMLGYTARITEREQSGRTVYRVRVGPYPQREDAEALREKMGREGIEAALVRVQK